MPLRHRLFLAYIIIYESDGLWITLTAEHHLEELLWHPYAVAAYHLLFANTVKERSADDIYRAVFACPVTTENLEVVPLVFVKSVILSTDICKEERLLHGLTIPFAVACGTHVASVVA